MTNHYYHYLRIQLHLLKGKHTYPLLLLFCLLCLAHTSHGQDKKKEEVKKKSFLRFFKKSNYVIAPLIAYKPVTSWQFGVGVKYLYRPKNYDTSDTRKSFAAAALKYTLKNQLLFKPSFVHFFNHENFVLDGRYVFQKFPQNFYGIGNETSKSQKEMVGLKEVKTEQIVFKKIKKNLFGGFGFRAVGAFHVRQKPNGILETRRPTGWDGFGSLGPTINMRYDNRDNILNASRGQYIDVRLEHMSKAQRTAQPYTMLKFDSRKYIKPIKGRADILAGQFYMQSTLKGDVPFSEMAFVGSDALMRGYFERRYIDRHFMGGQVEFRHPLPYNFGVVAFAGLGDVVDDINHFQLQSLKYSVGAGIRYKIIPKENINVRFDFGIGRGSHTFYINIAEAF